VTTDPTASPQHVPPACYMCPKPGVIETAPNPPLMIYVDADDGKRVAPPELQPTLVGICQDHLIDLHQGTLPPPAWCFTCREWSSSELTLCPKCGTTLANSNTPAIIALRHER
jgi:hypothetical protein